ncbi:MAG: hypothetical protein BM555_04080 [Crocinitomix sp. MedPE-SWsnd]|nr:MAG: hypothetical protein BM555_04080 [Crocinitomix sp. MedPE-SWsnd]
MKYLFLLITITSTLAFGQDSWEEMNGEQRAFFYNVSRRKEVLKPEVFHLFEFTDSIPWINDTLPNYRYVERKIVDNPDLLVLHADQFSRKSNGIVSDVATHFALWELDATLKFRNSDNEKKAYLKPKLKQFEKYVLQQIPASVVKTLSDGSFVVDKAIQGYYEPGLQTGDKLAGLLNAGFSRGDQRLIINAISKAEEKYVNVRSKEIFDMLGGECEEYVNLISAAGDGSGWSSLEGNPQNPYNRVLPDDRGLFAFNVEEHIKLKTFEESRARRQKPEVRYLSTDEVKVAEFRTSAEKSTTIHLDVFGYHPERQTTLAIQKGGSSYILYGKNDTRLLSPDSAYGEGTTYWRLIKELEEKYIKKVNDLLYGKRGYEYLIDRQEKAIVKTELLIKKTEYKLDKLRHRPAKQPKIKKKKIKKKDLGKSDQSGTGHPTSALNATDKKTNIEQNRLIHLNTQLSNQKRILAELKLEMEKAYFLLQGYKTKLDKMQKHMGYLFMTYEQEDDIFTFKDGSTFNYATQDFTFANNERQESFFIYHIAFGKTVFAKQCDETFIHINLSSVGEKEKYTYEKVVAKNRSKVEMTVSDSIQLMEIFREILDNNKKLDFSVYGGGILGESEGEYYRDSNLTAVPYNKDNELNEQVWKYRATKDTKINLSVEVWQDEMLPFNFADYQKGFDKLKKKNPGLTEIDYTSAIKARKLADQWKTQMKTLVPIWFDKAIDQAKLLKAIAGVNVGKVGLQDKQVWAKVPLVE